MLRQNSARPRLTPSALRRFRIGDRRWEVKSESSIQVVGRVAGGRYASGFGKSLGQGSQFDVVVLRIAHQEFEGLVQREPESLHQEALSDADRLAGTGCRTEPLFVVSRVKRGCRETGQNAGYGKVGRVEGVRMDGEQVQRGDLGTADEG